MAEIMPHRLPMTVLRILAIRWAAALGGVFLAFSAHSNCHAHPVVVRSIQEARDAQDNISESSVPIELEAVVNFFALRERLLFVHDGTDAIFIRIRRDEDYRPLSLVPGDRLRIVGRFDFSAQHVLAESVELVSSGMPVPAIEADLSRTPLGMYWCKRVKVQGRVESVVHSEEVARLCLRTNAGTTFLAQLPDQFPKEQCESLTNATVEITATLDYVVDDIGRPIQFLCRVSETEPPEILEAFEQPLPEVPIVESLDTLRNTGDLIEQRMRVRGQLTYVADEYALLEDPSGSLLIHGPGLEYTHTNEMVEAVGQMTSTNVRPEMRFEFLSRGGLSDQLPPKEIHVRDLVADGVPFRHCIVSGTIQHFRSEGMQRYITLKNDGILFEVQFQASAEAFENLRLGDAYSLRARGLVMPTNAANSQAFIMLVNDIKHVGVEVNWLAVNRQRIFLAVIAAVTVFLLGAAWVITLQLQVRRKTERLNQITARLNSSYEAINEGILVVDLQGKVESSTRRLGDILGCKDKQISSGDDFIALLQPQIVECERFEQFLQQLQANPGVAQEWEFQLHASETPRVVVIYSAPVRDSRGAITARLWSLNDITERKSLENSLVQSQKMEAIGRLAGGIAHDFNNLLMAISGNLELAKISPDPSAEAVMDSIEAAEAATDRAARVVRSLLRFARQSTVDLRVENANDLVLELRNLLPKSMEPKVDVRHDLADDLWLAKIDGTLLQQVMLNICLNACDAVADDGGWISIKTRNISRDEGDYIRISIADSGAGIPEEVKSKIFEPFFTTKPPEHGTGLGLAISYAIIDQHQGRIECASKAGFGSRFDIYLPRAMDAELANLENLHDTPLLESKSQ